MNDSLIESIQISKNEISLLKKVGGGNYGDVWEAKCRGSDVIVKVPKIKNMKVSQIEEFYDEIMKMCKLRHPNIVLMMGAHMKIEEDLTEIQIVMEKLEIDLKNLFKNSKKYPLTLFESISLAKQAAIGMMWLHESEVIHCDYKPANLLYSFQTKTVKICDFGFSKLLPKGEVLISHSKGTPTYAAPEIFLDEPTSFARDVYSYGIAFFPHIMRKEPHESWTGSIREFAEAVVSDNKPLRPKLPKEEVKCPKSLRKLAQKCWKTDQYSRPTFASILDTLEIILVDCAIFDEEGRRFWKSNFMEKDKLLVNVEFNTFSKAFLSKYSIQPEKVHEKLVRVLFCKNEKDVNIEHFGKILGFFESLSEHKNVGWVNWLADLFKENKYIFGKDSILLDNNHYLVRFSSENYDWSLVCGDQKIKINHAYGSNVYSVGSSSWNNLHDCVNSVIKDRKWNAEPVTDAFNSFYNLIQDKKVEIYI